LNICEGWPKAIKLCELQFANTSSEACTTQYKHAQHSPSPVQAQLPIRSSNPNTAGQSVHLIPHNK